MGRSRVSSDVRRLPKHHGRDRQRASRWRDVRDDGPLRSGERSHGDGQRAAGGCPCCRMMAMMQGGQSGGMGGMMGGGMGGMQMPSQPQTPQTTPGAPETPQTPRPQ